MLQGNAEPEAWSQQQQDSVEGTPSNPAAAAASKAPIPAAPASKAPIPAEASKAPIPAAAASKAPIPADASKAPIPAAAASKAPIPAAARKAPIPADASKAPIPAAAASKAPIPAAARKAPIPADASKAPIPADASKAPIPADVKSTTRKEYGLKPGGVFTALETFNTLFALRLSHRLFSAAEEVSKSLQRKDLSVQEAVTCVNTLKSFYRRQRTDASFDAFYDSAEEAARELNIGEPALPRYRRQPRRLDDGSQPHRHDSPKDFYRQIYFQACDLLVGELTDRFDQDFLKPVLAIENVLLSAANGDDFSDAMDEDWDSDVPDNPRDHEYGPVEDDWRSWGRKAQAAGVDPWTRNRGKMREVYARHKKGELRRSIRSLNRVIARLDAEIDGEPQTDNIYQLLWSFEDGRRDTPVPDEDPMTHPMEAFVSSFRAHPGFDIVAMVQGLNAQVRDFLRMVEELRGRVRDRLDAVPHHEHPVLYYIARGINRGECGWEEPLRQRPKLWTFPDPIPRSERRFPY
ncbi:tRNA selenocysteine 1-associated protein 1 [Branchiostoma belcheri]|nr:tRNA selenocysteine 1-associated protein 1 [Branchiostoma belcheri]